MQPLLPPGIENKKGFNPMDWIESGCSMLDYVAIRYFLNAADAEDYDPKDSKAAAEDAYKHAAMFMKIRNKFIDEQDI